MSEFPLWSDLLRKHPIREMYPSPIEKDNPAPVGVAEAIPLTPRSPVIPAVTEAEMTDAQMKKREEIVKSMKDKEADFKDRYGDRWKEVMYATATKMAMGESTGRLKVGDYVHAGFAVKGGAGFSGRVDKIDGNYVYVNVSKDKSVQFKDDPLARWGDRIIKAPIKNVSLQEDDTKYQDTGYRAKNETRTEGRKPGRPIRDSRIAIRERVSNKKSITEADDLTPNPNVPLRMQAAMVIAKSLGSVKGSGQVAPDLKTSGGSPEAIVNQAIRIWLTGSHTPEGWALGAKMLKLAKQMGIQWDSKLVKSKLAPITLKKLGLDEADAPKKSGISDMEKLRDRQQQEKDALMQRQEREKATQQMRDAEQKIRQQQLARATKAPPTRRA